MSQLAAAIALGLQLIAPPRPVQVQFVTQVAGRNVTICLDGRDVKSTFAGKLGFRDRRATWSSLCAGVRQPVRTGQSFWVLSTRTSTVGGRVRLAGNIAAKYLAAAKSNDECAALQLAIWEAIEDGGSHADFSSGHFAARASDSVLGLAEEIYEAVGTPGEALWLETDGSAGGGQNQITQTRV